MRTYPESADRRAEHFMSDSHIPERSLRQRMDALGRANDIRTYRANLKLDIKAGNKDVTSVLQDPPDQIDTMKLFDLIMAMPKYGRTKVNRIFVQCRISPSKTVGGLSERQRGEIVAFLRRR